MKIALYKQVYDQLKTRIQDGTYPLNEKLPLEQELVDEFAVSSITLKKALELLKEDGYISRRPRVGTFVISNTPPSGTMKKSGKQPIIGCIMTNFDDTFGTQMLSGILEQQQHSVHVIVKKSLGDIEREEQIIQELIELNIDGLLLLPTTSKYISSLLLELTTQKFPIVVLDRQLDSLPISSAGTDNDEAGLMATQYLIDHGHKKIAMITADVVVSSVESRIAGFIRAHALNHIQYSGEYLLSTIESVVPNSTAPVDTDIERIKTFIQDNPQVTAIIAAEYNIALFIKQACAELNLRIPEDISVLSFDHPEMFFDHSAFTFTHIKQRQYRIGAAAVDALVNQINDPDTITKTMLEPRLIIGNSTAAKE